MRKPPLAMRRFLDAECLISNLEVVQHFKADAAQTHSAKQLPAFGGACPNPRLEANFIGWAKTPAQGNASEAKY